MVRDRRRQLLFLCITLLQFSINPINSFMRMALDYLEHSFLILREPRDAPPAQSQVVLTRLFPCCGPLDRYRIKRNLPATMFNRRMTAVNTQLDRSLAKELFHYRVALTPTGLFPKALGCRVREASQGKGNLHFLP